MARADEPVVAPVVPLLPEPDVVPVELAVGSDPVVGVDDVVMVVEPLWFASAGLSAGLLVEHAATNNAGSKLTSLRFMIASPVSSPLSGGYR